VQFSATLQWQTEITHKHNLTECNTLKSGTRKYVHGAKTVFSCCILILPKFMKIQNTEKNTHTYCIRKPTPYPLGFWCYWPTCVRKGKNTLNKINIIERDITKGMEFSNYIAIMFIRMSMLTLVQHLHKACSALQNENPMQQPSLPPFKNSASLHT